jgi:hypothetical protein
MEWDKNRGGKKITPPKKDAKPASGEHSAEKEHGAEPPAAEEHH